MSIYSESVEAVIEEMRRDSNRYRALRERCWREYVDETVKGGQRRAAIDTPWARARFCDAFDSRHDGMVEEQAARARS